MHTINIRVTHKKADIPTLEAISFPDVKKAVQEIAALPSVKECVIIQTCNRVEIFAAAEDVAAAYHDIMDCVMDQTISRMKKHFEHAPGISSDEIIKHLVASSKKFHDVAEVEYHAAALRHLLRLTSGLESMIVGEDQILGQVRDAYQLADSLKTVGPFFRNIFSKALNVGKRVRTETEINKGAVSIGSAAVELAESIFGSLEGKTILLIGAGEMGTLVAKSLIDLNLKTIIVANRTYERAVNLAKELNAKVLKFEKIKEGIKDADLIISATGAPRAILTKNVVEEAIKNRKKELVIIDVAIPRDVEEDVKNLPKVRLFNIDGLREIAENNKRQREKEAAKVEAIIEEALSLLEKQIYHIDVEWIVKTIFGRAEHIRQKELGKAIRMLGDGATEEEKRVIDDLTRVIINRTMAPIAENIRKAAETSDTSTIKIAEKLFIEGLKHRDS